MRFGHNICSLYLEREVNMFSIKWFSLFNIFAASHFFLGLSLKKRDRLMKEMLRSCPPMDMQPAGEMEVGYEASWLMKQAR